MKILTMDDFIKRIQSRLKYNGITASKAECRDTYCQIIPQKNWNNPSADQVLLVVQRLTDWNDSEASNTNVVHQETSYSQAIQEPLVSEVSEVSEDLVKTMPQPETIEIISQNHPDLWETLQPPDEDEIGAQALRVKSEQPYSPKDMKTGPENSPAALSELAQTALRVHGEEQTAPLDQESEKAPLAKSTASNLPVEQLTNGINQLDFHQAISQAVYQLGVSNSTETNQLLTVLANELSSDIKDTKEMVAALVTAYLNNGNHFFHQQLGRFILYVRLKLNHSNRD